MHICLVSREYPPETAWGGIGTYVYNWAHTLAESGYKVTIVAINTSFRSCSYYDKNVQVIRLHYPPALFLHSSIGTIAYSLFVARTVNSIAKDADDQFVVEAPDWFAEGLWLSTTRQKFPTIVKLHTPHFLIHRTGNHAPWRTINWLEKKAACDADAVFAPSQSIANVVGTEWGIPTKSITISPYPVNTELYSYPDDPCMRSRSLVLFAGRLEVLKGVYTISKAIPQIAAIHPNVEFVFVGKDTIGEDGYLVSDIIRKEVSESGVDPKLTFVGSVPLADLVPWYQRAQITLVPSLWDNFPNVALEAMCCGSTVVGSNVGGLSEIITDAVDGRLVPPDEENSLAEAVIELLSKSDYCRSLGDRAAINIREKYSFPVTASREVQNYQQVLDKFHGRKSSSV